jgi:hypothetical protein
MRCKKWILPILTVLLVLSVLLSACSGSSESVAGKYLAENKTDYIELNSDGTFALQQDGDKIEGKFAVNGSDITLQLPGDMESSGKVEKNVFTDNDGLKWTKE